MVPKHIPGRAWVSWRQAYAFTPRVVVREAIGKRSLVTDSRVLVVSVVFALLFLFPPTNVEADTLLFDNGADLHIFDPIDTINAFHQVSDDFALSSTSTLQRVVFGESTLLLSSGVSTPLTVDWCIGTTPFSGNVACSSGATIAATATGFASGFLTNFSSTFSLPNLVLGAGTYYLTLANGTSTLANNDYWSVSTTSGDAQLNSLPPAGSGISALNNEASFQIYGTVIQAPEPGSLLLLSSGLLSCATLFRHKR